MNKNHKTKQVFNNKYYKCTHKRFVINKEAKSNINKNEFGKKRKKKNEIQKKKGRVYGLRKYPKGIKKIQEH